MRPKEHIKLQDSDYEPTDSDDDLSENDLKLLKKARNKGPKYSDSEEEIYGVRSESEDEEDVQSEIALSDVEGQEDDGLPNAKAWGKKKSHYYATDYVDQDYGGFQGQDAEDAEKEEEETRNLQAELVKQLDDDDFSLGFEAKEQPKVEKEVVKEVVKTDITTLSKRQRLELLQKESPEFFGLVEDYESKMELIKDIIYPVIKLIKQNKIEDCRAKDFVMTYYELILNYFNNIYMYMLLKSNRVNVQKHPIIKRLYQFRELLNKMEPVFDEVIKPQLELLVAKVNDDDEGLQVKSKKKKTLKLLSKLSKEKKEVENKKKKKLDEEDIDEEVVQPKKKLKESDEAMLEDSDDEDEEDEDGEKEEGEEEEQAVTQEGDTRRQITYQMFKNKGLMPVRKKEQRNPRVKHRNKYRKAKIRRKGAVREVRTEMSRYGGEISGIKASVTKSIKIK
ncbi:PREDICTED: something about silencing protein 10 [Nicrophorus vespilloides]|uniref:Something about silencing protein 10 n=1 Tax=Nicrophorus vespilloides TaxID=110193 RepID=A0ABM1MZE1_NICVS|nr:PREDICTED: something about silencing protein 10 [Nicrophorus vespilloides]